MSDKVASCRANSSFVLYSHMSQQTYFFPKPIWFEFHLQEKKNWQIQSSQPWSYLISSGI